MQIPTPQAYLLCGNDWEEQESTFLADRQQGRSDAGNPRSTHLESLVTERDGPRKPPEGPTHPRWKVVITLPCFLSRVHLAGHIIPIGSEAFMHPVMTT